MARQRVDNRREFLQLAHTYDPNKHFLAGKFASEKLDGFRAFWDGGITRGIPCFEIPFANTAKDDRYVTPPIATGLWTRYGKSIQAPLWFLDELPKYPLDGELYLGRGKFQRLRSITARLLPDDNDWAGVRYKVFGLPDFSDVFRDGTINVPNFEKVLTGVIDWLRLKKITTWTPVDAKRRRFETVQFLLEREHPSDNEQAIVSACKQTQLPYHREKAEAMVEKLMAEIVSGGGEGLIIVEPGAVWEPQRTHNYLKIKPDNDCEVIVKGFIWGRETNRGSKLLGKMGAMIVDFEGKRLELSGFTDEERVMQFMDRTDVDANQLVYEEGTNRHGKEVSPEFHNPMFPIGSKITIKYRELTVDKLPKEARYWRKPIEDR